MNIIDIALRYKHELGLSVIPQKNKHPLVPWTEFQNRIASDEEICKWWTDYPDAGISAVVGSVSGVVVVDCDSESAIHYFEDHIPDSLVVPYSETPRGGRHYYFACNEKLAKQVGLYEKTDFQAEASCIVMPPSVGFNGKSYNWIIEPTSYQSFPDLRGSLSPAYIKKISTLYAGIRKDEKTTLQSLQSLQFLQEGNRDQDIFHLANCLARGGYERELTEQVVKIIGNSCNPPFPSKEAITKVDSAYSRTEKKERNLTQEVRDYVSLQDSYIYLTDAYTTLQTLHSSEKAALQVILHRLCKDGTLEKTGRGTFKKIELDCSDIDIWNADTSTLDIKYPFGIEEYVDTYPKNIIVIAGEPNSGKTAFLLNFAKKNMDKHEVIYFSSEMGGIELKSRLVKFNLPMDEWKKVAWKERASDFAAMIRPNAINIIDFLEVHEEFYKVGLFIKQIFDKLDQGIAIIGIQKPKGRDEGLGGQRGIEKPRLYLAMEPGLIKIVKGKNWKYEMINPNGKTRRWKLVAGCRFTGPSKEDEGRWEN